ncbi:insulinase family protein [Patescibacteria group bacterium]|nr:insulinase family protein [Patescibacteria group bacterium]
MYKQKTLKNGLRLILSPLKETQAVTVLVLVGVGSRHEEKQINGISHFIEHMMFKGTNKRPTSLDITKELDSVGASFNAFTSKDHTGYYIKISSDKVELAFDLLSDMLFYSKYNEVEINKEKGVIIEEINMYEDNPLMSIDHFIENTIYGDNSLGWLISGSREVIKSINQEKILKYINEYYQPANMIVTVAGNFNVSKVQTLTKKYFLEQVKSSKAKDYKKIKLNQDKQKIQIKYKKTEQVMLALGFLGYSFFHKNYYAQTLLAVILGGNMSSRLFTEIREKRGLAYFVRADAHAFKDTGSFIVMAGLDKTRINPAIALILQELKKIKNDGVTAKELKSAKEFIKGKLILELEDSESIADWYGKQELLTGKMLTPEQKLKKVMAVKLSDIQKVAKDIFKQNKINLALIGPYKDKKSFEKLLKI